MEKYSPLVWITGASSGIGRAVAIEMAKKNYRLIISGRNEKLLAEVSALANQAEIIAFDVTSREQNLLAAKKIEEKFGYIDKVFLNAGNCEYVDTQHFDSSLFERMIKTNFLSMVYGVEVSLPLLRASKQPHIIGMSSSAAFLGFPRSEAYGSSKAAIRNFLQCLRMDLLKENIRVSIVFPGFVKTPLTDKNDFPMPQRITAEEAAEKIVSGIEQKKNIIKTPIFFVAILQLISFLPETLQIYLMAKLTKAN